MRLFRRKEKVCRPIHGKIELFSRHCLYSKISQHKKRPVGFSHEQCFRNLLRTVDRSQVNLTFFLDTSSEEKKEHYLFHYQEDPVIQIKAGSEASAFLDLLEYITSLSLHPDTLIYIVEDDYFHRPDWVEVLKEGFSLPVDYVTLYDHRDKYFLDSYRALRSQLFITPRCHWRTTPSTTHTFAVRFQTLLEDKKIHRRFSEHRTISEDHRKFCDLHRRGRVLISSLPGWSTHAEPPFASPCIDWEPFFQEI